MSEQSGYVSGFDALKKIVKVPKREDRKFVVVLEMYESAIQQASVLKKRACFIPNEVAYKLGLCEPDSLGE